MNAKPNNKVPLYTRLAEVCERLPDKTALIFKAEKLSYRQLLEAVDTIAVRLRQTYPDVQRIGVLLNNSIEVVLLAFAAARLGRTIVPLNPALRKNQLLAQINLSQCSLLITGKSAIVIWRDIAPLIAVSSVQDLLSKPGDPKHLHSNTETMLEDFIITLSSGSTGAPKPIVLSQACKCLRADQAAESYAVDENDTVLCASPFYHSLGQRLVFLPLLQGASLVLLEHFSLTAWIAAVRHQHVTFTIAVASHLQALQHTLLSNNSGLDSLRCLVSSSALLSYPLKKRLIDELGCQFHEMYGATEVATATDLTPQEASIKPGSVGRALPQVQLQILDEKCNPLPAGETGEIAVRSPHSFNRYDGLPEQTDEAFCRGYFLTGDLGYLDRDGYLFFVSRKKDIIITGGINVVPADIENEIRQHPDIFDCCVIARADDYLGEAVHAVCVARESARAVDSLQTTLQLFLNQRLAGFQQPRSYTFLHKIPLTGSGKPDKESLRRELSKPAANTEIQAYG